MRRLLFLLPLVPLATSTGCTLMTNAARNIYHEHALSSDEAKLRKQTRRLAKDAWARCGPAYGPTACGEFEDGYIDGYADYLYGGRTTDPWPAPPRRLIYRSYTTPEKLRSIEEYQAGFHQGACDALASGLRKQFVVPIILPVESSPIETIENVLPTRPMPPKEIKLAKHEKVAESPKATANSGPAGPPWSEPPIVPAKANVVWPPIQLPN